MVGGDWRGLEEILKEDATKVMMLEELDQAQHGEDCFQCCITVGFGI